MSQASPITPEMAQRYGLPANIEDYPFGEKDWYMTFLMQTDYVANKIAEALYLGETLDQDYSGIIAARKYAREMVNSL